MRGTGGEYDGRGAVMGGGIMTEGGYKGKYDGGL